MRIIKDKGWPDDFPAIFKKAECVLLESFQNSYKRAGNNWGKQKTWWAENKELLNAFPHIKADLIDRLYEPENEGDACLLSTDQLSEVASCSLLGETMVGTKVADSVLKSFLDQTDTSCKRIVDDATMTSEKLAAIKASQPRRVLYIVLGSSM